MKVLEANEGRKIPFSENGTWLSFDDQIMINLKTQEADKDVHIDITSDAFGCLRTGEGLYYVAQIDIPARQYIEEEVENSVQDSISFLGTGMTASFVPRLHIIPWLS